MPRFQFFSPKAIVIINISSFLPTIAKRNIELPDVTESMEVSVSIRSIILKMLAVGLAADGEVTIIYIF